ncbi:MAG: hypothetical protein NTY37_07305 [Methanothrix sp.]|nr:hypothetical protein [Methanothrix sp.]
MSMGVFPLVVILAIMAGALVFHNLYINKIFRKVKETNDGGFKKEELLTHLELPQGSNFNTFMIASWMLFFVALALFFFQTPGISPWYYFQAIQIASSEFGLIVFGLAVMIVTALAAFSIPKVYRYYIVSRGIKALMVNFALPLLMISIAISIYHGTVYPQASEQSWDLFWILGYVTLVAPLILLITPIVCSLKEVAK